MSGAPLAARVAELAALLDGTGIAVLTLSQGGETLTLRREPGGHGAQAVAPDPGLAVAAPCPGVFLAAHPLRDGPLAAPGQAVAAGAVLGLLRAGPLLVEVAAPVDGTVVAVAAAEGDLVGFGTVLFRLAADTKEDLPCPST